MAAKTGRLGEKYEELQRIVRDFGHVAVAFSGGVDSALLLKVCKDILDEKVLAVTARSHTTAKHEENDAIEVAGLLGVEHLFIESGELAMEEFVNNPPDRCYICKKARFRALIKLAKERGIHAALDGENADDRDDYRPGARATRELGVRSPLREARLTKKEIRSLSKQLGLPTWNKPAYACLATRIPYGERITEEKLIQVDRCEEFIRKLIPSVQARVRRHGETARIEVESKAIAKLAQTNNRKAIAEYFKQLGFLHVAVDLEGYMMGSLNRSIETGSR